LTNDLQILLSLLDIVAVGLLLVTGAIIVFNQHIETELLLWRFLQTGGSSCKTLEKCWKMGGRLWNLYREKCVACYSKTGYFSLSRIRKMFSRCV